VFAYFYRDTAGQERYRSITTAYYRGAKGVLIVYDLTQEKTFLNANKWVNNFRRVSVYLIKSYYIL